MMKVVCGHQRAQIAQMAAPRRSRSIAATRIGQSVFIGADPVRREGVIARPRFPSSGIRTGSRGVVNLAPAAAIPSGEATCDGGLSRCLSYITRRRLCRGIELQKRAKRHRPKCSSCLRSPANWQARECLGGWYVAGPGETFWPQ